MATKLCPRCKETKDLAQFGPNKTRPDGLQVYCKPCNNAYSAEYRKSRETAPAPNRTKASPAPIKGTVIDKVIDERHLRDLAITTRNWALQIKACVHEGTGAHGHFTVSEWMAEFGRSKREWGMVRKMMEQLGYPLSLETSLVSARNGNDGCGFYLGTTETWAQTVASDLQDTLSRLATQSARLRAIGASGKADKMMPIINDKLISGRHEIALDTIPLLLKSAGFDSDGTLERLFLPAQTG